MAWDSIPGKIAKGAGDYFLYSLESSAHDAQKKDVFNSEQKAYYANVEKQVHSVREKLHNLDESDY